MQHILFASVCALVLLMASQDTAQVITISTVPVGNPGNPADTQAMDDGTSGYGSVAYSYSIGEYDVTVGQYAAFLNAVAATDTYGLYNPNMATNLNIAGIAQNGTSGSYTYSVINSPNHPITYVSWGDSVRFANWLANGQPHGFEGPGTTETGSYTLNGATTNFALSAVVRNSNATWVIPTENEWYKAAYYNPTTSSYYGYPCSSNNFPISTMPGSTPNAANLYDSDTGYAVTGSTSYSSSQNYLTDVGAYSASASPYGAFDMGGDVWQWYSTPSMGLGVRGASWDFLASYEVASWYRYYNFGPTTEEDNIGFRVALVPEPSTLVLASIACGLMWTFRKRCK